MPEDVTFSGYNVPKGVFIFANMAAMSRMEEYFPRPDEYQPERWLRDHRTNLQTTWTKDPGFLSLPFSAGMRSCPGKRFAEQGLYLAAVAVRIQLQFNSVLYSLEKSYSYVWFVSVSNVFCVVWSFVQPTRQFSVIWFVFAKFDLQVVRTRNLLLHWVVFFQILQRFKLDYAGKDEMGMIHMPFTTPDRPLNIKFTPRTEQYQTSEHQVCFK